MSVPSFNKQVLSYLSLLTFLLSCSSPQQSGQTISARTNLLLPLPALNVAAGVSIIVNSYLNLGTDAHKGDRVLNVSGNDVQNIINGLNADLAKYGPPILMIMQPQGATLDTTNSVNYGKITNLNGAGLYEFVTLVSADSGANTLTVAGDCGGIKNDYSINGHTQIVVVPRYSSVTLATGASIVAPAWGPVTPAFPPVGGVVAMWVTGGVEMSDSASINASGLGFRGGVQPSGATPTAVDPSGPFFTSTDNTGGGQKGESIGGYENEYLAAGAGPYGQGAPANGGGGGNSISAGGGGGANGITTGTWTGQGIMKLLGADAAAAWSLDPADMANHTSLTTSIGGGRGGYSYSLPMPPPPVASTSPGNMLWKGDNRKNMGGWGGEPLNNDPARRVFFGGGGGQGAPGPDVTAGGNNPQAGLSGGTGGGFVYLLANSISGTATSTIAANGSAGKDSSDNAGKGGPGGGGAGGTIIVQARSIIANGMTQGINNITISAQGGLGGSQLEPIIVNSAVEQALGPGGGGGGGFIALYNEKPSISSQITGALSGTTIASYMTGFPNNGATAGANGISTSAASPLDGANPSCVTTELADLSVTLVPIDSLESAPSAPVNFQSIVKNLSSSVVAWGIHLNVTVPASAKIAVVNADSWTCTLNNPMLDCILTAPLQPGATAPVVSFNATPTVTSTVVTATVVAQTPDPDFSNNVDSKTITFITAHLWGGGFTCGLSPLVANGALHKGWMTSSILLFIAVAGWLLSRRFNNFTA